MTGRMHHTLLSDKMPHGVGFVRCLLSYSLAMPWQQCSGQQGQYTGGTLRKQFTKPSLRGILSVSRHSVCVSMSICRMKNIDDAFIHIACDIFFHFVRLSYRPRRPGGYNTPARAVSGGGPTVGSFSISRRWTDLSPPRRRRETREKI